jgi:preprotein translocase subunit YajC
MQNQSYWWILEILLFVGVIYFFMIRPQQKQRQQRTAMINALRKGDRIVTIGGLHGTIVETGEDTVTLKVGDNVRLVFDKQAVGRVLSSDNNQTG